jgi:serine protease Do
MARLLSYLLVFLLGFTACAWVVNRLPPYQGTPEAGSAATTLASYHATTAAPSAGDRYSVADAVARVEPAVVNIDTIGRSADEETLEQRLLRRWFGRPQPRRDEGAIRGVASGVIVHPDGYVVTNNHVVSDAEKIRVTLPDKREFEGQIVGTDPEDDLAIVKIDGHKLPIAPMGDSSRLRKGEWVIAIGNPLGFDSTVTVGVVSAERRGPITIEGKTLRNVIQTDAAINQGNSGGALLNLNGELVGINTAIVSTSMTGGSIGIGFSIPINDARPVVTQLIQYGRVLRPWIGIKYEQLSSLAAANEIHRPLGGPPRGGGPDVSASAVEPVSERGVVVKQVAPGSPADEAGLREGDIIRRLDAKLIANSDDVYRFIGAHTPGQRIRIVVQRRGQATALSLRLGQKPSDTDHLFRR